VKKFPPNILKVFFIDGSGRFEVVQRNDTLSFMESLRAFTESQSTNSMLHSSLRALRISGVCEPFCDVKK